MPTRNSSPRSNAAGPGQSAVGDPDAVSRTSVRSNGAYNAATFFSTKRTGARTSKIVDPPNGRLPPQTAGGSEGITAADREFRLALIPIDRYVQETSCRAARWKLRSDDLFAPECRIRSALQHRAALNRNDGPEDSLLAERCLTAGLPEFGGANRQLPPHRADSGRHYAMFTTTWGQGQGVATQYRQ